ncbi:extensin-like domain-containing protein [Halovulum sp. GXIMD14793]
MPPPPHIRQRDPTPPPPKRPQRKRSVGGALILLALLTGVLAIINLPDHLNPFVPLDPTRAPTAVTPWKLAQATSSAETCFAALDRIPDIGLTRMQDREDSAQCHIRNRVSLRSLSGASLRPVETRCDIALRLYMWQRHTVAPAAWRHFGADVSEVYHFDSFSCRRMRTSSGTFDRMSLHATAGAIDIAGLSLSDGRKISLIKGWQASETQAFLKEVRDGACDWFRTVLSPDYNALHADHFHFAQGRWPVCR